MGDCIQRLLKANPNERLTAKEAKQHAFVIKYHVGCSTDALAAGDVGADERLPERPSVETRRLRRDNNILTDEMKSLLEGKSNLEQQMFDMTVELEQVYEQLRKERARADKAEEQLRMLCDKNLRAHGVDDLRAGGYSNRMVRV